MPLTRNTWQALVELLDDLGFYPDAGAACLDLLPSTLLEGAHRLAVAHPSFRSRAALLRSLVKEEPALAGALVVVAVYVEQEDLAEHLLSSGAPATEVDVGGKTALIALSGYPEHSASISLARRLLAAGCPVDAAANHGQSALMVAFEYENPRLVSLLLEAGATMMPNQYPWLQQLVFWCRDSRELDWCALARQAVGAGADPSGGWWTERPPLAGLARSMGRMGCSQEHHLDLLDTLLELGADASAIDNEGMTVLDHLLSCTDPFDDLDVERCRRAVQRLVAAGCDTEAHLMVGGWSSLGRVLVELKRAHRVPPEDHQGLLALLGILLEAGADPLAPMLPGNDMTPLPFALLMVATHLLEDVPAVAVEMVRMLAAAAAAAAAAGLPANVAVVDGPSVLNDWLCHLHYHHRQSTGGLCLQATPAQLELTQTLLHYCCPQPWPDSHPRPVDLFQAALQGGIADMLLLLLRHLPGASQAAAELHWGCKSSILIAYSLAEMRLLKAPEPHPQEGLTLAHVAPALALWRQVPVLARAGAPAVELHRKHAVQFLGEAKEWAKDLLGFAMATAIGTGWAPDTHFCYPKPFREATRMLLLVNGCRGFGERRRESLVGPLTRSQRRREAGKVAGVKLPPELIYRIIAWASHPLVCWCPQLLPHLNVWERQALQSLVPGLAQGST